MLRTAEGTVALRTEIEELKSSEPLDSGRYGQYLPSSLGGQIPWSTTGFHGVNISNLAVIVLSRRLHRNQSWEKKALFIGLETQYKLSGLYHH